MTTGKTALIICIIISFLLGAWPLALILLAIFIYQMKKSHKVKTEDASKKETNFYKTAAEVEHSLNRERDAENEYYYK